MWKRRKQLLDEVTQLETATPHGSHGLLVEIRELLRHILRASRVIVVTAVILIIVVFALQLQVSSRNEDIRQTKVTAEEAKQAAAEAKQVLEAAINNPANAAQAKASQDAIDKIARIEAYLCGGPCPPVSEGTEGTNN